MKKIGIIGSGAMGTGIAQVAAQAGCEVVIIDTNEAAIEKSKISFQKSLDTLIEKNKISPSEAIELTQQITWATNSNLLEKCELIIEAIIEDIEIKKQLFTSLEKIVTPHCILATNTSSLSITQIASSCKYPERVIGIHFFNPAPIMKLVEIIPAIQTNTETKDTATQTIQSWQKITVLAKDTPGFIVNKIARPFYSEALRIADEGIANIETIDYAMKALGFKMGPFELMDLIGNDVNYAVTESVWKAMYYDTRYKPSLTQKKLVEANYLGKKTNRGFYQYPLAINEEMIKHDLVTTIQERILVMLFNEALFAEYEQIATAADIDTAVTKGVNYPKGLLTWLNEFGREKCKSILHQLYITYQEERYRACRLL